MEKQFYLDLVSKHTQKILETERYIWKHPESGFKEWNTSAYMAKIFEDAGYTLNYAGDIPGWQAPILKHGMAAPMLVATMPSVPVW